MIKKTEHFIRHFMPSGKSRSFCLIGLALLQWSTLPLAKADSVWEFSLGFSFNRSLLSDTEYTWTRRMGASAAWRFSRLSGVEFSFQDAMTRLQLDNSTTNRIKERILSLNWVQSVAPSTAPIQPFLKVGAGQINRDIEDSTVGVVREDTFTGVVGLGLRIFLARNMAFRCEATSYLQGFNFSTFDETISGTVGLSLFF